MRFKRVELSPANKKQYSISLGKRDIELMMGTVKNAQMYLPRTNDHKEDGQRLTSMEKCLREALNVANLDGDDGSKLPIDERQRFKDQEQDNPMHQVTRLEIIDYTETNGLSDFGKKSPRKVIFHNSNFEVSSDLQDQGRTLKLFIDFRKTSDVTNKHSDERSSMALDDIIDDIDPSCRHQIPQNGVCTKCGEPEQDME